MRFDKSDVTICGNVANKPELRRTNATNTPVANFRVAVSQGRDTDPEWYTVAIFGDQAVRAQQDLNVGDRVIVVGNQRLRPFTDRQSGQARISVEIWADDIGVSNKWNSILSIRPESSQRATSPQNGAQQQYQPSDPEVEAALAAMEQGNQPASQPAPQQSQEALPLPQTDQFGAAPPIPDLDDDVPF